MHNVSSHLHFNNSRSHQTLRGHNFSQLQDEPVKCSSCGIMLKNKLIHSKHIRIVHGEAKHKCKLCNLSFHFPCTLNEHIGAQHEGKKFHCTYPGCRGEFNWSRNAKQHLRGVHQLSGDEYVEYCGLLNMHWEIVWITLETEWIWIFDFCNKLLVMNYIRFISEISLLFQYSQHSHRS